MIIWVAISNKVILEHFFLLLFFFFKIFNTYKKKIYLLKKKYKMLNLKESNEENLEKDKIRKV